MSDGYTTSHGGGPATGVTVDTSGTTLVLPNQEIIPQRRYVIITAPQDNVAPVWMILHATLPAVVGAGIVLYPGDSYEILDSNMYMGPIRGIVAAGTEDLAVQVGH